MARIRSVHPSLFTDEAWVSCSPVARILYIGLWTDADDQGVFVWRPMQLKMRLLPGDQVDISELLKELAAADLIRAFEHEGRPYGAIKLFQKYQRPKKPNAIHPFPDELRDYVLSNKKQRSLFDDDGNDMDGTGGGTGGENLNQMEDGGGNRKGGGGEKTRAARKPETSIPIGFPGTDEIELANEICRAESHQIDVAWQARKFRTWAEQNGKLYRDWRACWRGWIERSIHWDKENGRAGGNVVALQAVSEDRQRAWMQDWLAAPHQWKRADRGPAPDEDGCRISAAIMAEFGHQPRRAM